MARMIHQGGAAAEVDDSLVAKLLATGEWDLAGAKPAPVRRPRKAAAPKPEEASATEE